MTEQQEIKRVRVQLQQLTEKAKALAEDLHQIALRFEEGKEPDCVQRFFDPHNHCALTGGDIPIIFMCIDPSLGVAGPELSIVTCFYTGPDREHCSIAGLEMVHLSRPGQTKETIQQHLTAVRETYPGARNAKVVFIIEYGFGFAAMQILDDLESLGYTGNGYHVAKGTDGRTGVRMTKDKKRLLGYLVRSALRNNTICFKDKLITVASDKDAKTELKKECIEFEKIPMSAYVKFFRTSLILHNLAWNLLISSQHFE